MKKKMEDVEVETNAGRVMISQFCFGQNDSVVTLAPEQVDTLVEWLQEAKKELLTTPKTSSSASSEVRARSSSKRVSLSGQ